MNGAHRPLGEGNGGKGCNRWVPLPTAGSRPPPRESQSPHRQPSPAQSALQRAKLGTTSREMGNLRVPLLYNLPGCHPVRLPAPSSKSIPSLAEMALDEVQNASPGSEGSGSAPHLPTPVSLTRSVLCSPPHPDFLYSGHTGLD